MPSRRVTATETPAEPACDVALELKHGQHFPQPSCRNAGAMHRARAGLLDTVQHPCKQHDPLMQELVTRT